MTQRLLVTFLKGISSNEILISAEAEFVLQDEIFKLGH